jgi:DNA-directed RNA polymerase specialized sigma24 family protein
MTAQPSQDSRELLRRFLQESDEERAAQWLERFLHELAMPLINAVLRRKLGVDLLRRWRQRAEGMASWECPECGTEVAMPAIVCPFCGTRRQVHPNPSPLTTGELDAEDVFSDAMAALIERMWQWWEKPDEAPLDHLPQYLVRLTLNTLAYHRRRQFPNRHRLRLRLLYLLEGQGKAKQFALWDGAVPGEQLCGFWEWRGQARCSSERYGRWCVDPHRCALDALPPGSDPKTMPLSELLTHLFRWLGGPMELDDLLTGLTELLDIHDYPEAELSDDAEGAEDVGTAGREQTGEFVARLWDGLWQLPVPQRRAFLLKQEREVWECFLQHGCGSWKDIARLLEMSMTELEELLAQLPLNDAEIARRLRLPHRQKVINLRHAAIRRLRHWLKSQGISRA